MRRAQGVAQELSRQRSGTERRPTGRGVAGVVGGLAFLVACQREAASEQPARRVAVTRARAVATATLVAEREPEHAYAVGQRAIRAGYSLKVTRVLECTGEHGQRPGRDQLWLGLELVAAALGPGSFAIGHSHARLVDGRGRVSAPLLLAKTEQCEPLLKYTRLAPGSQVAGWIVFAIPREAETLTLQVSPRAYLNEPPTLFKLGR